MNLIEREPAFAPAGLLPAALADIGGFHQHGAGQFALDRQIPLQRVRGHLIAQRRLQPSAHGGKKTVGRTRKRPEALRKRVAQVVQRSQPVVKAGHPNILVPEAIGTHRSLRSHRGRPKQLGKAGPHYRLRIELIGEANARREVIVVAVKLAAQIAVDTYKETVAADHRRNGGRRGVRSRGVTLWSRRRSKLSVSTLAEPEL